MALELPIRNAGRIPYDKKATQAQVEKKTIIEYDNNTVVSKEIKRGVAADNVGMVKHNTEDF